MAMQLILRTTGLDSDQGPTAAQYILEKANTPAYCYRSRQTAIRRRSGASGAGRPGPEGNANVVFFDGITAGEKDFSTLVARLKK